MAMSGIGKILAVAAGVAAALVGCSKQMENVPAAPDEMDRIRDAADSDEMRELYGMPPELAVKKGEKTETDSAAKKEQNEMDRLKDAADSNEVMALYGMPPELIEKGELKPVVE